MLRGDLKIDHFDNSNDLNINIFDWKSFDNEEDSDSLSSFDSDSLEIDDDTTKIEYIIKVFGITRDNLSIVLDIKGFKPYFYVKIPQKWDSNSIEKFMNVIKSKFTVNNKKFMDSIEGFKVVKRMIFRGFSNYQKYKFLKIIFKNKKTMRIVNYILKNNNDSLDLIKNTRNKRDLYKLNKKIIKIPILLKYGQKFDIFESNIDPMLRFIHEKNLNPAGWLTIAKNEYTIFEENKSNCQISGEVFYKNVRSCDCSDVSKLIIASFDIECDSSHGDFPLAKKDYKILSAALYDKYHNKLKKMEINKDLINNDNYKNINNPELYFTNQIKSAFCNEKNPYDIDYVYTKKNKKPNEQTIKRIYGDYYCSKCKKLILIPNNREKLTNEIKCKMKKNKLNFSGDTCILNDTIVMKKNTKEFDWNNIKLYCNNNIDDKSLFPKRCDQYLGVVKDEDDEEVKLRFNRKNIDDFMKIIQTPHGKDHTRDENVEKLGFMMDNYLPTIEGDKIIQIGTVVQNYGEKDPFLKHIVTLGSCSNIPGVIVESFEKESDLLIAWSNFIIQLDPGFLTGYNIFGFDYQFIYERAQELGCLEKFAYLGRIKDEKAPLIDKTLSSAGLGDNVLKYIQMDGRINMDLLKIIQRDHNLNSYKLDSVSSHFINGSILNIEYTNENHTIIETDNIIGLIKFNYITLYFNTVNGIEKYNDGEKLKIIDLIDDHKILLDKKIMVDLKKKYKWGLSKDDVGPKEIFELQKQGPNERAIVAKYCLQDCELCINLCKKLDIITNNIGMANVCSVPLSFIFLRGQGIKIFSLVAKQCREEKYLIPLLEIKSQEDREGYEGAIVLPPKPGIYLDEPISVLDYASLYPSSMISENLSHETICTDKQWLGKDGELRLRQLGYTFKDITYDNYKYIPKGKSFVKIINTTKPTVTCRFVQPKKNKESSIIEETRGVLPRILRKLLKARKETRKKIPMTNDPFKKSVLNGQQLAYKITANSLYGAIGSNTSQVSYKEIAASTTATGRRLIYLAKNFVEENYPGCEVIYGDTDSIFINFKPKDENGNRLYGYEALKESIKLGTDAGIQISKNLEEPHDLEYEKTFCPFILFSKKRYVGNKYEIDPDKYKQTSMGIVLKRRDNAQIVKHIYGGIIDIIMNQKNIIKSIEFLRNSLNDLLKGKFTMDNLIISKSLKAYYKDPDKIAHKVLADRIGRRDPGNKPQPNDRIQYVYIEHKSKNNETVLQGDKIETPAFIKENKIPIDYYFYITNQILKPVCQIYALILEDLEGFKYKRDYYSLMEKRMNSLTSDIEKQKKNKEKIQKLRMKDVEEILFSDSLRKAINKKQGKLEITNWFRPQIKNNQIYLEKPIDKKKIIKIKIKKKSKSKNI